MYKRQKLFWSLRQNPDFVLNRTPWDAAGILVALDNFGCGSSREHAPWALLDFGIRCVIAPSIADIFYSNCFKNGILPIVMPEVDVARLIESASNPATARMIIDLPAQTITSAGGELGFEIDARRKADLIGGVDEIGTTMEWLEDIRRFEKRREQHAPWLKPIDIGGN